MSAVLPNVHTKMNISSSTLARQTKETLVPADLERNDVLPELRQSTQDRNKSLSTWLQQNDFIPKDVLFSLTQPPESKEKLGPLACERRLTEVSRPPPANVWNHKRRNHFKHLLEHAPCSCGAGKDISFLYDVTQVLPHPPKPELRDQSSVRKEDETTSSKLLILPDSVIPEEYHIVKNKGVLGIQYHEDKYSTKPHDHEKHLVVFPSMNPTSRFEVIQLKNTFESMMNKAGINDSDTENGPTQIHNLLEIIKKEQNIYNLVLNELIRQTTVECTERGELLHQVWNKYHELLNKVPEQIMSLHEEVIAQRALDRRLTDELMRFKGTIGTLTGELTDVKEHDRRVTKEAQKAQEDLRSALIESQKNASLLEEYHDLYELQRQRLERQVFMLSEERELWSTAAYSLALKVTDEYKLNTAKRLQVLEKSWIKVASHFTVLLSDRDTDLHTRIQNSIEKWRDLIGEFHIALKQRESNLRDSLNTVHDGIKGYQKTFGQKYISENGVLIEVPDERFIKSLTASVKSWAEIIIAETDLFGGINLLNSREAITQINKEVEGWTDCARKMFGRHCGCESKIHPEQANMDELNKNIDLLQKHLQDRATGDSGIASMLIRLQNSIETWENRLMSSTLGVLMLQESDWESFYQVLEDWLSELNQATEMISVSGKSDDKHADQQQILDIHDVIRMAQKWATRASNSIDSEDTRLVEQVSSLHSEMVRWMIQVLLRLAPDKEGNSQEAAEMALLGSTTIPQLIEVANILFETLETFSNYVSLCCDGIVAENTLKRQDNREDNADYELNDLKRLRNECTEWIVTAQILLSQLTGESIEQMFPARPSAKTAPPSHEDTKVYAETDHVQQEKHADFESKDANETPQGPQTEEKSEPAFPKLEDETSTKELTEEEKANVTRQAEVTQNLPTSVKTECEENKKIEVLGMDANTHRQSIEIATPQGQQIQSSVMAGSSDARKAFEALAAVDILQNQLIAAEERSQVAEERALKAEAKIVALEERIRAFERQHEKQNEQAQVDLQHTFTSPAHSKSQASAATVQAPHQTDPPKVGAEVKEEKSGRRSGKSSSKSTRRK